MLHIEWRHAWRALWKTPGATMVAVVSLALGIGANTAIFSLVNTVLLRLLPVRSPEQLYLVATHTNPPRRSWSYPDYCAMRDHNTVFNGLAAYGLGIQAMGMQPGERGEQGSELVHGTLVSGNYFDVLGVSPALGRVFNSAEDRAPDASPYVVLSHSYWQRRFNGDAGVIGRKLRLNGYPFTVIGIAPSGFTGTDMAFKPDMFVPILMRSEIIHRPFESWNNRHNWWMGAIGRMKPGAPAKKAEAELSAICKDQQAAEARALRNPKQASAAQNVMLVPAARGYSFVGENLRKPLLVLFVIVALVLLIACANVANLMLARGAARQREIAVRLAIGASRWRVTSQMLAESIIIAALGGAAGLLISLGGVRVLSRFAPAPSWAAVHIDAPIDWVVLAFTMAVSLLTGLLFGIAPALRASRPDLIPALKEDVPGSTGASRFTLRKALVIVQVALSLLLLVGASLFVRSLGNLRALDTGFARENVAIVSVDPTRFGYNGQRTRGFYDHLRERVSLLPGVRSTSLAFVTPLSGSSWNEDVTVEGYTWKAGEHKWVYFNAVAPRYFETLGTPIIMGREFREEDNPVETLEIPSRIAPGYQKPEPPGPKVLVVNEAFARHFFGGRSPLGMHVALSDAYRADKVYEIVGVVRDARYMSMREAVEPMLFLPIWRQFAQDAKLVVRTAGDVPQLSEMVRREVAALDPVIPLLNVHMLEKDVNQTILIERLVATLSGFFGVLALLLAVVGLYGIIAFAVTRRTREIGIRVALGAQRGAVVWLVFRDALLMVAAGAAIGLGAALALTRMVQSFLYGIGAQDPASGFIAVLVLGAAAALATLIPARRATRVDPMEALRYE